jgi:quinoprotein glucose dehydrogenase
MPTYESDVCIIGGGLCSAMLAEKLSDLRPGLAITVVEAGSSLFDFGNRLKYRQRVLDYGESAWPGDVLEDQAGAEGFCLTMAVGGQALRWGSAANRFSEEDLRLKSMYGLAVDWPLSWAEMEKAYCEAERRLNVCGEPSPFPGDKRSEPYPQPPMPLSYNLQTLRTWAEKSGIPFTIKPQAKNHVSPTPDLDHPGGGCRMGTDPAASVCDSYGRTHDHENLFVVGAPTVPTAGCTNGALTFVALALRSGDRIAADFAKRK